MKVSTLTIEMAANVARLRQDMDSAQKTVDNAMANITSAVKVAGGALVALGAGLTAGAISDWVREAIDAADAMSKMAQKTGLAVKEVAGLQLAFDQAGAGDKFQQFLAKLAKSASDGNDAFAAMGVTINNSGGGLKTTRELIGDVADKFSTYRDGAEKTALAQELFGKSGADLIPLLNAGAGALDEYDQKASALGLTLTDETVKAAEAFNDQLDLISQRSQGVARQIASELLPALGAISEEFAKGSLNGGTFSAVGTGISIVIETVSVLAANLSFVFQALARDAQAIFKAAGNILTLDFSALASGFTAYKKETSDARKSLDDFERSVLSARSVASAGELDEPWVKRFKKDAQEAGDAAKNAAPIIATVTKARGAHKTAIDQEAKAIAEESALLAKLAGLTGSFYKDWDALSAAYQRGKLSLDGLVEAQAELLAKQPAMVAAAKAQIDAAKASNAAFDEQFKAIEAVQEATEGRIKSAREMLESIERETSLMGLSNDEREQAIALFELERQGVVKGTEAYDAYAQKIKQAIAVRSGKQATQELNKATLAEWTKTVDKYDDIFRGGFADMLNNGKGAWDSFTTSLTTTFKTSVADQIYKMFAQPFVVKFVGSMLGIVGGVAGGVANAGSAASTGLSVLSGASSLANIAGSAGALGTATGAISGFTTALTAGAQSLVGITGTTAQMVTSLTAAGHIAAPGVAAGVSAGSSITTALGSIGPAGWAAIAVLAVAAIASGRGETRSGASYITGKDGQAVKEMGPSGGEIAGDQVRALFDTTTTGINSLLKSLGSQASVSAFVAGLESSKAGKGFVYAGGTLSTGAKFGEDGGRNGGQFVFGSQTAEEAIKGYSLRLKQSTLQALQITADIPVQIKNMLDTADILSPSEAAIDQIMSQISTFIVGVNSMRTALDASIFTNLRDLSFKAAAGLVEASGGFEALMANLASYYENFYSAEEKRAQTIKTINAATAGSGLDAGSASREQFRAIVEAQDRTTESGQKTYAALLGVAGAFAGLTPVADSTAKALADAAAALAKTNQGWINQLAVLTGAETDRSIALRDAGDDTTRVLMRQVYAQEDLAAAIDLAAQSVANSASAMSTVQGQYQSFVDAVASAQSQVDSTQAGITSGYLNAVDAVQSAQDGIASIALQAAETLAGLADNIRDFVAGLDQSAAGGLSQSGQYAAAQADYSIALAQAQAGDAGAMGNIAGLAGSMLELGKAQATSALDYRLLVAQTKGALLDLAGTVGAESASVDPMLAAQNKLVAAQADLAKWAEAASESGASTTKEVTDYASDWRKANAAYKIALGDKNIADAMVQGLDLVLKTPLQNLADSLSLLGQAMAQVALTQSASSATGSAAQKAWAASGAGTESWANTSAGQVWQSSGGATGVYQPATSTAAADVMIYGKDNFSQLQSDAKNNIIAWWNTTPDPSLYTLYDQALKIGVSGSSLDGIMGWAPGASNDWALANGLPKFANGGYHSGGARLVGEHGAEIEVTGPSRIYSASDTAKMLRGGGADNSEVVAELRALAARLESIERNTSATAGHTAKSARQAERVMPGGDAITVRVIA